MKQTFLLKKWQQLENFNQKMITDNIGDQNFAVRKSIDFDQPKSSN